MPPLALSMFAMTADSVRASAPAEPGVYALRNTQRWVCVGQSLDLQKTLLLQIAKPNLCVRRWAPKEFAFEVCRPTQFMSKQGALIMTLQPVCKPD